MADRGTTAATATQRRHEAFDRYQFHSNRREECVQMDAKVVRSAPQALFGLPKATVAVPTSLPVLQQGRKNANIRAGLAFIRRIPDKKEN